MLDLKTHYTVNKENKTIVVKRNFNAPIEDVWNAWTNSEVLDQWWAPKPWKANTKSMNFKVGGMWLYSMDGPGGEKHWAIAEYSKVEPLKNFVGHDAFCDENGNKNPELPTNMWDVKFHAHDKHTSVEVHMTFQRLEDLEKTIEMGFKQGFEMAHGNLDELFEAHIH